MSIEVKAIVCPQCGSTDVRLDSEEQGICKACGALFALKKMSGLEDYIKALLSSIEKTGEDDGPAKVVLKTTNTKEQFLRNMWMTLAKEDAPFEVFNQDFGEIVIEDHQVYHESAYASVTYQATIGNDRQEQYTDWEDYYEEIPFINEKGEREIRKEKRQRAVTKTRKVTDWTPGVTGEYKFISIASVSNLFGDNVDLDRFNSCLQNCSENSWVLPTEEEKTKMDLTDSTVLGVEREHEWNIKQKLEETLPGDHHKDVTYNYSLSNRIGSMFLAREYSSSIVFENQTYTKRAFCFGPMIIGGDTIKNKESLMSEKWKIKDSLDSRVWKKTRLFQWINLGLLGLSILFSFTVHVTALVALAFALAVASFVMATMKVSKTTKEINKEIEREIEVYEKDYLNKQKKLLNNKLSSLGLETV